MNQSPDGKLFHRLDSFLTAVFHPSVLEPAFTAYLILQLLAGCPVLDKDRIFSWLNQVSLPLILLQYFLCLTGVFLVLFLLKWIPNFFSRPMEVKTAWTRLALLLLASIFYATTVAFRSNCSEGFLSMLAFLAVILFYGYSRYQTALFESNSQESHKQTAATPETQCHSSTFKKWISQSPQPLSRTGTILVFLFGLLLTVFIAAVTVFRYLTFKAPGFDFGLFAQMFEQMNKTGLPMSSYERNQILSHFAIHISPVFYLMLPFYKLFPRPETLQILQALVTAAGLFPLMKLAALANLKERHRILLAAAYCFYPALSGGCFYDLHENCFLTVFLLFLLWAMEKNSWSGILISTLLICSIKEDAPLYAICTGLYYLFSNRRRIQSIIIILLSSTWMMIALWYLGQFGEGSMTYRFSNLLYRPDGSMFDVLITVLLCPGYALMQCFQADRLPYLAALLIPLALLPVYKLRISELLLCIPFFLINLMPNYTYQHDIHFQYQFGVTAILFFLFLRHYSQIAKVWREGICFLTLLLSLYSFQYYNLDRLRIVPEYFSNQTEIQILQKAIEQVPKDAIVQASPFLVAHLYQWDEVYSLDYDQEVDYVLLDLRYENGREKESAYQTSNWKSIYRVEQTVAVYCKSSDPS